MKWFLVFLIVAATAASDVLQSLEMKRHGEVRDGRTLAQLLRRPRLLLAIAASAVSFFAFMKLLSTADLSFAVPATAATYVVETVLARFLLKERICGRRWASAALIACGVALLKP